ncbi:P-loop NTPase fold protein [Microbacterium sp. P06]|uniref:KAP family P-loop NTPase fold protein n=1 Tax=Microbacterium sp. P06 TaxID=3366949 RepID=UPI00374742F0
MNDQILADAFDDDPLAGDDEEADHLGRRNFARSAIGVLQILRRSEASSVVGLVGSWGGGKTSVLNMIKSLLPEESPGDAGDWIIADFNPWFFQDMATLQMAFFRELGAAIPNHGRGEKARSKLADFGHAVAPFGSIVAKLGGPDLEKSVKALSDLVAPNESVTRTQAKLEQALRELDRPVLVVLDDLDRLAPDELLLTLKLIRLIGRLPNVHYLIAYDEDTLLDGLSRTGLVGADSRRGLDYLEKIIQVRLDVPPLRQRQLDSWIERVLINLQERHALDFEGRARGRLTHAFYGHMRDRLATPRAVKRYISQVEAFIGSVRDEIDAVDFLVVTWLRTAEPLVYDMIARERSALLGEIKNIETADLFGKPDKDELRRFWAGRLERARVAPVHMEGVADLLGLLFPRFRTHWKREDFNQMQSAPPPGRIHNPDYFDRFFAFGVPPEDISDADAGIAFRQITVGERGGELAAVESKIGRDVGNLTVALTKMKRSFERELVGGVELLHWIARQRERLDGDDDGMFTPELQSRWTAQQVYVLLPDQEVTAAIDRLAGDASGLDLASYLVAAATQEPGLRHSPERAAAFDAAAQRFAQAVRMLLERYKGTAVFDVPADAWGLIRDWQIIDNEEARKWLQTRVDSGAWPLIDVVARFVSRRRYVGVPSAPWTIGDLDVALVDRLFGLQEVIDALDADISAAERIDPDLRRLEDTRDNRRAVALSQLKTQRRTQEAASAADPPEPREV